MTVWVPDTPEVPTPPAAAGGHVTSPGVTRCSPVCAPSMTTPATIEANPMLVTRVWGFSVIVCSVHWDLSLKVLDPVEDDVEVLGISDRRFHHEKSPVARDVVGAGRIRFPRHEA